MPTFSSFHDGKLNKGSLRVDPLDRKKIKPLNGDWAFTPFMLGALVQVEGLQVGFGSSYLSLQMRVGGAWEACVL